MELKSDRMTDQGKRIEDTLRSHAGEEVILSGTFGCGLHPHPAHAKRSVLFTIPNGTPDRPTVVIIPKGSAVQFASYGTDTAIANPTYCDLVSSLSDAAENIVLVVDGDIDGRGAAHPDVLFHGVRLWGASECHVGGAGRIMAASNGIGGGGNVPTTESFALDFPGGRRGTCIVAGEGPRDDRLELVGGRSTGLSQNGGKGTDQGPLEVDYLYSHHNGAHGGTSWDADELVVRRSEFAYNKGSGLRREWGDGHVDDGVFLHDNPRGLNLLGCTYEGDIYCVGNADVDVELNAVRSASLRGIGRPPKLTDTKGKSAGVVDKMLRL